MKSLKLIYSGGLATFDLVTPLTGVECDIQNAMVNVLTTAGTDSVYPAKGTNLLRDATRGALVDMNACNHISNFAAASTLRFGRSVDYADNPEKLTSFTLLPISRVNQSLVLNSNFKTSTGNIYGSTITTLS